MDPEFKLGTPSTEQTGSPRAPHHPACVGFPSLPRDFQDWPQDASHPKSPQASPEIQVFLADIYQTWLLPSDIHDVSNPSILPHPVSHQPPTYHFCDFSNWSLWCWTVPYPVVIFFTLLMDLNLSLISTDNSTTSEMDFKPSPLWPSLYSFPLSLLQVLFLFMANFNPLDVPLW